MAQTVSRVLRTLGVQLAVVAASIHVWWGAPRAAVYLRAGTVADPQPFLFVASAAAVFAGVVALFAGYAPRRLYAAGAVVMVGWSVGYVWWHLGGHGGAIPGVAGYGHPQLSELDTLVSDAHLLRPLDAVAMTTQVGAAACLLALRRLGDDGPADPTPRVTLDE